MAISTAQLLEVLVAYLEASDFPRATIQAMREQDLSRADVLEQLQPMLDALPWVPEEVRKRTDVVLKAKGLPSLASLRLVLKDRYRKILERGSVRNDEEFYMAKELLSGPAFEELSESERMELAAILACYEDKAKKASQVARANARTRHAACYGMNVEMKRSNPKPSEARVAPAVVVAHL